MTHYIVDCDMLTYDRCIKNIQEDSMSAKSQSSVKTVKTTFFRRKNRNSYSLNWTQTINISRIANIISERQEIPFDDLVLVHKGKQIRLDSPLSSIQHMQIIHVVNLAETRYPQLTITVKNNTKMEQKDYRLTSDTKVKDFICQKIANINTLPYFYIGLVYLGKVLHPQKTFQEEMVENEAEVIYVDIRDYVKLKQNQEKLMNITDIIDSNRVEEEEKVNYPQIVVNQYEKQEEEAEIDPDLLFSKPQKNIEPLTVQTEAHVDYLELGKNGKPEPEAVDLNQTKYPMSINQLQLQSRYGGNPNNETRYLFERVDSLQSLEEQQETEMPELPQLKFEIKISHVDSVNESEEDDRNRVEFNEQDTRSIYSQDVQENIDQISANKEESSPDHLAWKKEPQKKEELGSRDIQLGEMIVNDGSFKSQTANFIEKILQDYKFMFQ